jgi:hypothetical protein
MKQIIFFLLFCTLLAAQKFSHLAATQESYLNFTQADADASAVYIDESTALAWQNSIALISFKTKKEAQAYCHSLKLEKYHWSLPTTTQLQSLPLYSYIAFGQGESYFANNTPVWDNRLHYGYDSKKTATITFKKETQELYVRCVAQLEE